MNTGKRYRDRYEAGQILATHLHNRLPPGELLVLGLPRGGVPVALEVARALGAPLGVCVVRKLGVPGQPELAMGAIAAGGYEVLDESLIARIGLTPFQIAAVADRESTELARREARYCSGHPPICLRDRFAVLVDDGLATGFTMRAAIEAARGEGANGVVVAVPVGARDTCAEIRREVDVLVCPFSPDPFHAVGLWYRDFEATTDDEVCACLDAAAAEYPSSHIGAMPITRPTTAP
ncbi:MAG TPA: phosphoribosyltransferase [Opitutaceae bacterium]|nr:phosphoribosyltransferase [Opitutaceae bacterium]